jgi:UDP-glucose 4-epimerase
LTVDCVLSSDDGIIGRLALETNANHHGMNVVGLRFFSVYQGFGGNEEHKGKYANTVAQFAGGEALELFGDCSQTRDLTHVTDVARSRVWSPTTS